MMRGWAGWGGWGGGGMNNCWNKGRGGGVQIVHKSLVELSGKTDTDSRNQIPVYILKIRMVTFRVEISFNSFGPLLLLCFSCDATPNKTQLDKY